MVLRLEARFHSATSTALRQWEAKTREPGSKARLIAAQRVCEGQATSSVALAASNSLINTTRSDTPMSSLHTILNITASRGSAK